jgi:hypothetical protein
MAQASDIWYIYGVVPTTLDVAHAPDGLDDKPVELCIEGNAAALFSRLDGERYAPGAIERGTEDVEWLAPRAIAHDRVLTWASDKGPVVPLPVFSLFSGEQAVRGMLRERSRQLDSALRRAASGREYALRVYRIDSELSAVAAELSPKLAQLQQAASAANPGQRYLLERKLDTERKNELRLIGARVARDVVDALRPHAIETSETRVATRGQRGEADAALILDAAFLIEPEGLSKFQRELTDIVQRHGSRGFRFDFTGPWPPYHFVRDDKEASSR